MKADNLGPLIRRAQGQLFDSGQVVRLVAVPVFELGGSDSDISHGACLLVKTHG